MLLLSKAYRCHNKIGLSDARNGEKNWVKQLLVLLPFLRHITQIQIDIIINVCIGALILPQQEKIKFL